MNELEKEYLQKLIKECSSGDIEINHGIADEILCNLLEDLGYKEIVNEFRKLEKWYA